MWNSKVSSRPGITEIDPVKLELEDSHSLDVESCFSLSVSSLISKLPIRPKITLIDVLL